MRDFDEDKKLTRKEKRRDKHKVKTRVWSCRNCPNTWSMDISILLWACPACEVVNWK